MKGRNVYSLDTPYAQQKTAQQAADKAYARKIHKHRFLAMIGIIGVFVLVFGVQIWNSTDANAADQAEKQAKAAEQSH